MITRFQAMKSKKERQSVLEKRKVSGTISHRVVAAVACLSVAPNGCCRLTCIYAA